MFILKQLRREKNISQSKLAEIIGVSLRTIQLYEKKDANIPRKNLTKIAQYFDLSIAELYEQERVTDLGGEYRTLNTKTKGGHTIKKLGPGRYLVSAPLVIVSKYENYVDNYDDEAFIDALPKVGFLIDRVSVGKYMAFEISNDSMDDGSIESIPNKSVVLGKLVPSKKVAVMVRDHPNGAWIIEYKNRIMCKRIADFDRKGGILRCSSLNSSPEYSDFELDSGEVRQFYTVIKRQL